MTEVTSTNDPDMLINHFESSLYLHYYLSSWNNAVIAVLCCKCTSKPSTKCEIVFKSHFSFWIQSYGLEFRCQEALKHILAGFCTPEMDRKFDQGTFVSRKVTVAEVLLYLNILYRNMLQLRQLPLVSSLTVRK